MGNAVGSAATAAMCTATGTATCAIATAASSVCRVATAATYASSVMWFAAASSPTASWRVRRAAVSGR
eukprot:946460-Rhodomonas_salina.1